MCWSKHEREEWLRLQREWEEEPEVTSSAPDEEVPEQTETELGERDGELVRV
ncbi:MAG TPA: hypothetical protein VGJ40_07065 [Gaiellaceae bacterium]|jgi:hypothetical protein